jgi:hypothetical protein
MSYSNNHPDEGARFGIACIACPSFKLGLLSLLNSHRVQRHELCGNIRKCEVLGFCCQLAARAFKPTVQFIYTTSIICIYLYLLILELLGSQGSVSMYCNNRP